MAIQNGTACRISVDTVTIATVKTENFSAQMATRDTTTKSSAGSRELAESIKQWSCDASGLFNLSATATSVQDLMDSLDARTQVSVVFASGSISGTRSYSGSAYITDVQIKAEMEGNVEFSVKMEGTGALTMTDHA